MGTIATLPAHRLNSGTRVKRSALPLGMAPQVPGGQMAGALASFHPVLVVFPVQTPIFLGRRAHLELPFWDLEHRDRDSFSQRIQEAGHRDRCFLLPALIPFLHQPAFAGFAIPPSSG